MKNQHSSTLPFYRRPFAVFLAALMTAFFLTNAGQSAAQVEEKVDYGKISQGKSLFRAWCRTCHGEAGKGDGPMAEHLKVAPSDLTLLSQNDGDQFYFGRVAARIDGREKVRGHGSKDMPVWGEAFGLVDETGDQEAVRKKINALVHYLRSIQATDDASGP